MFELLQVPGAYVWPTVGAYETTRYLRDGPDVSLAASSSEKWHGMNVIRKEAWLSCRTSSGFRL